MGFFIHEHLYTYRKNENQNILERKLFSCFGQLVNVYWKNDEHEVEHDVDNTYGLCVC